MTPAERRAAALARRTAGSPPALPEDTATPAPSRPVGGWEAPPTSAVSESAGSPPVEPASGDAGGRMGPPGGVGMVPAPSGVCPDCGAPLALAPRRARAQPRGPVVARVDGEIRRVRWADDGPILATPLHACRATRERCPRCHRQVIVRDSGGTPIACDPVPVQWRPAADHERGGAVVQIFETDGLWYAGVVSVGGERWGHVQHDCRGYDGPEVVAQPDGGPWWRWSGMDATWSGPAGDGAAADIDVAGAGWRWIAWDPAGAEIDSAICGSPEAARAAADRSLADWRRRQRRDA